MEKKRDPYYQAQAILAWRDHSERELRQKLVRKKFSKRQVDEVIAKLKKFRLLDDMRFAQMFVESTLASRAVGRKWVRAKLMQRGIASDSIARVLDKLLPRKREEKLLLEAATQWRRLHKKNPKPARLAQFLLSRGFAPDDVWECVSTYFDSESSDPAST